ncbi:MAG TPA: ABC transporter permease [Petrimonas sp.]|uniref:ABC transporter permease n=1 Tax=Petrimonas sp. TaxID=2023866 RepID=UPI0017506112|nr:ABC transporter permease [Petrimonas sp.]MEA4950137.1 ABC transporter permease [Petrimonas sp.]MEA4979974.1 ABC transporter permease [Petrimonas sp.]MEA5045707.1 ABC transporter permease [Petrimonas sp.]MEA5062749.1 ABC transporter permease [Petrimonas sp.]
MKQFFSFVNKEFYHIFRDGRTMLILLGMPVVQILLFGFAINMEVQNIRTVVFDPAQDVATREIAERMAVNPYFNMRGYVYSPDEVNSLLKQGKIDVAVIFEPNFNENLVHSKRAQIQIITDASNPNTGTISANYVTAIIGEYQKKMLQPGNIPCQIDVDSKLLYNPEMKSAYTFVPGIMGLVLMIICAIMTSISIVREKEHGTMEVLLASPLKSGTILISKTVPYLALSFINLITILLLSYFVLNVPIRGNLALLVSISILFIFLALSLGLFISTLVQTQVTAVLISGIGLMMPTLILSGMIFPIDNMPIPLQWVSSMVPARWYISAVKKVMIEGLGFMYVAKEVGVLAGMALLLIGASVVKIKTRL